MIVCENSVAISRTAEDVFAFLAEPSNTVQWVDVCVELKKVSEGPFGVGAELLYTHKQGSKVTIMQGEVTAYEWPRRLAYRYIDTMFTVDISFTIQPESAGVKLTHRAEIQPKTLMMKLLSPLIRMATPRAMASDLQKLKLILEKA